MIKYFCVALFAVINLAYASNFTVDDSYTINQRYVKNHLKYPQLKRPSLTFSTQVQVDFNLAYSTAAGRELNLDIFRPNTTTLAKATVILVHGGGWRSGAKSHMYALANQLAHKGYVAIPVEYRLSIESLYPTGLTDINNAIVWLKKHANKYGINADNIFIAGGSSGGHMAALIAYSANTPLYKKPTMDTRVSGVIVLDGVLDFTSELALKFENKKGNNSAAALWLGGRYEAYPKRWQEASPVYYIDQQAPPLLYVSSGNPRFQAGLAQVRQKLTQFNITVQYHQFDNVPHTFWLFEPWLSSTVTYIDDFIHEQHSEPFNEQHSE